MTRDIRFRGYVRLLGADACLRRRGILLSSLHCPPALSRTPSPLPSRLSPFVTTRARWEVVGKDGPHVPLFVHGSSSSMHRQNQA